ncbi:MAG: carbamoyltransferase N-terminal domain-containing protein [Vicinamibacterales bacterium]
MNILGIWDGHDSGAALLQDGRLLVAVNEERLTRRKLDVSFPVRSIAACLEQAMLRPLDIGLVAATTSDPAKTLGRLWPGSKERYYRVRRRKAEPGILSGATRALKYRLTEWGPNRISRALSQAALERQMRALGFTSPVRIVDHHDAHAAGAAWASGYDACAVITVDGLGDGLSSTISAFRNGQLTRVAASPARGSLGVFFEHVTALLNMRELEDEGKVMALADYAAPVPDSENPLIPWVRVKDGIIETEWPGHALRGPLARVHWRSANEQFAFMAQRALERAMTVLAHDAVRMTGLPRLAMAGGVASNVKATRQVRLLPDVESVSVFPHMGDGGLALGAAVFAAAAAGERPRSTSAIWVWGRRSPMKRLPRVSARPACQSREHRICPNRSHACLPKDRS